MAFYWYQESADQYNSYAQNNLEICYENDFGISKVENNSTMHIGLFGKAAYMEPQILANQIFEYIKDSNIYSFGILMWEISSGQSPFKDKFNRL
ncbi:2778_t:CDS:2 [Funneliformis geosporum]|nr:2778_t:CDS:2 [Funneliformis geosporum]